MTYSYGFPWMLSRHLCFSGKPLSTSIHFPFFGLLVSSDFCLGIVWVEIGGDVLCCYIYVSPERSRNFYQPAGWGSWDLWRHWWKLTWCGGDNGNRSFSGEEYSFLFWRHIVVNLQLLSVLFGLFNFFEFEVNRNFYHFGNGPPGKKLGQRAGSSSSTAPEVIAFDTFDEVKADGVPWHFFYQWNGLKW